MADIQLSSQLFEDIEAAVKRQSAEADPGVTMQYLAAVIGFMLANQRGMPDADRQAYLDDLCGFAKHVYDDVQKQQQPRAAAPPAGQAFGIWEPSKD